MAVQMPILVQAMDHSGDCTGHRGYATMRYFNLQLDTPERSTDRIHPKHRERIFLLLSQACGISSLLHTQIQARKEYPHWHSSLHLVQVTSICTVCRYSRQNIWPSQLRFRMLSQSGAYRLLDWHIRTMWASSSSPLLEPCNSGGNSSRVSVHA